MTILVRSGVVAASRRFALELVRPSSVVAAGSGSSASIVGLGSVDFSACTAVSLNGVFSAEYDNYMIVFRGVSNTDGIGYFIRMRNAGTDDSTTNSYTTQRLLADGTTVSGFRETGNFAATGAVDNSQRAGTVIYLYGPNLTQPTAGRSVVADGYLNAYLVDRAFTHNQSTSYDGCTFLVDGAGRTFEGNFAVYGLRG